MDRVLSGLISYVAVFHVANCVAIIQTDQIPDHNFRWVSNQRHHGDLLTHLVRNSPSASFYYLLTGDSQYWYRCTPQNANCHAATGYCHTGRASCQESQGNYANRVQQASIRALIVNMSTHGLRPRGLIINGDLTNFGHREELEKYVSDWDGDIGGVPIYPGLGNHDYANNVDQCALNHCAHRMLKWFKNYIPDRLNLTLDLKEKSKFMGFYREYTGSLAYSWNECTSAEYGTRVYPAGTSPPNGTNCVHFIQMNNYPFYQHEVTFLTAEWDIRSAVNWLISDLRTHETMPILINFHDFDSKFSAAFKERLKLILRSGPYNILGIFFAHLHSRFGLHKDRKWCLNGRAVPLLYVGSIPANNYMMVKLNAGRNNESERLKSVHMFHANSDTETIVQELRVPTTC